jgi:heme-degrading monooxygenase HmoA
MDLDGYVWITTRKLRPGTHEAFSHSWRPRDFPEGMLRAYELVSPDGNEVVGVSVWDSAESRDAYRRSEVESERRSAMAPYVLEEFSGFYVGRELKIPRDCARPGRGRRRPRHGRARRRPGRLRSRPG